MRIIGILGSPHREGLTARLLQAALEGAREAGAEIKLYHLADQSLQACCACEGDCWGRLYCVRDRESTAWQAQLQDCQGLVMAVPVYCWQLPGLTSLFMDRMRWDTGSVLQPRNPRAALGIACAGGSGTGCVLALQALYRYFYNWAFHGIAPLPASRFNHAQALVEARTRGADLVSAIRAGIQPFSSLGAAMAHYEALPHMKETPLDELRLLVQWLRRGLLEHDVTLPFAFVQQADAAERAWQQGRRERAAAHLSRAYGMGVRLWQEQVEARGGET
ncbi:MAG: flavodoxin family protein [Anaerolineae bacterium]